MPVDWKRYPRNWRRVVRAIRRRSQGFCEWCGAQDKHPHPLTGSYVILTTAHLGEPFAAAADKHDKHDIRAENLAHLCQRCHLRYDIREHVENAKLTREAKRLKSEPTLFPI